MAKITVQEALNLTPGQIKNMSTQEIKEAAQVLFDASNKRYKRLTEDSRTANTPMAEAWKDKAGKNAAKGLKETPFSMKNYKTKGVSDSKARENARKALSEGQNALSPDKETNTVRKAKEHITKMENLGVSEELQKDTDFWREVRQGLGADGKGPGGMDSHEFVRFVAEHYYEEDDAIDELEGEVESEYQEDLYNEDAEDEDEGGDDSDLWSQPLRDEDRDY